MRIKLLYREGKNEPCTCEILNADTGERLDFVQRVEFSMDAIDMVPHLRIEVVPVEVEIAGEGITDLKV
jgi:hypothetical protein